MLSMSKGFQLVLKLIDSEIKACNQLFFTFKKSFFLLKIVYYGILSFNFWLKFRYFFVLLLRYSIYDITFVFF
jgi:hypothetical protein